MTLTKFVVCKTYRAAPIIGPGSSVWQYGGGEGGGGGGAGGGGGGVGRLDAANPLPGPQPLPGPP